MRLINVFALATFLALSPTAFANSSIESASTCLTDSTTGRDRKDLVKWIYLAISKHPEISSLSAITPKDEKEVNQRIGKLMTRLIADACPTEINTMVSEHGPGALSLAFEVLGKVAMQELMTDQNVNSTFSGITEYTDQKRIDQVLKVE